MGEWKQCPWCGQGKDESEFAWRDKNKGYLNTECKTCIAERNRERYKEDPEHVKEVNKSARQKMIDEAQYFIYDYLSTHRCDDCGEYDFAVLTFYHTGKKKMNISDMAAKGYSLDAIKAELDQCIVLCFNCHMRRESEERSGGRFRRFWPGWLGKKDE